MTHIQKLFLKGFKSFAKPTELVFGKNFNCCLGANGSGKSCAPDTEVLLTDGSIVQIEDLVEKELSKAKSLKFLDDGVYCISNSNTSVFTLNPETMKIENKPVAAFVRRAGEPNLYKITTKTGKGVTTTGCHPVMIFKDGSVKSEIVEKLSTGNLIATPRNISLEEKEVKLPAPNKVEASGRHNKTILFPLQTSIALGRWLGLVIGDGYINYNRIEFVNADKNLVKEFIDLSKELFNISNPYVKKTNKSYRIIYHSRRLSNFIYQLFKISDIPAITSEYKIVPDYIIKSNLQIVASLISGLIDTDGYVSKRTPTLDYTSKSEKLVDQVQLLLLRFGIVARKNAVWKCATNTVKKIKRRYLTLTVEGKEKLEKFTNIPITRTEKRKRLYFWAAKNVKPNPNLDVLPQDVNLIIKELVKLVNLPVKPLRKKYSHICAYVENICRPTRLGVLNVINLVEERFDKMANALKNIQLNQQNVIQVLQVSNIPLEQASRSIGLSEQVIGGYWANGRVNARPQNLENLYVYVKEEISTRLAKAESLIFVLKNICSSDIYWDEIVSIKKVKGTKYVYDLSILDNHNFVAQNIFVHNSNIMDALTFVLGKTSAKSMRAEKSANLIFNGGKKGGAMHEAEVSIYFDNTEKEFPINAATIKLTRLVRENGNSIYKINDETMTRQQVIEVLSTATIDPDGHNIILQGDIIHFMDMHPEERRQIIEEIAGISVYEDKKQKALNELGRVDQRISDAEIILTERSTYLRELKKDRDHALKYKELEENIKSNKATYLEMQVKEKNDKLEENEKKINEHNEGITKVNTKIADVKNRITERKTELENTNKEIEQKGEIESVALQKDIENLKTDNVRSSERLNTCKNELGRIDERKKQLNSGFRDIEKTIDGLEKSKIDLANEDKKLVVDEEEFGNKIKDFKAKHGFGNQEELAELEKEIEKKEQFLFRLQEQRQDFLKEKYQIDAKINNIKENVEKLKELESKSNIKKFKTDIKEIEDKLKRLISEDSSLGAQLQKSRINLKVKSEELSRWQFRQVGLRESSMGDIAVRKIIEMNKKGVYGTVSELGKVDSKYSLALEVAAGARIRSLVVEDDKIAADCIKFLKQNKLGTATFLPLNTIKPRKESNLTGNGIHGNAIELITFDAKFKTIFSYVFGGTVVVEDVETARKLGLGKARLVTLEGDLFELSGAIIGGYRRKSKGIGFQEKEADDNLGKLNSEVSELQSTITTLEKRKEELENEVKKFRTDKAGLEGEIIKAEKSLGGVNLDSLKKELNDLEKAEIHEELKKIESRISSENISLDPLKETRQKLRSNAAGVGDSDAADNLTALENKKQLLHERVIQVRAELKNIESQIINIYLPEKEKTLQIIKQHEKEFENFKKEAEDLNNLLRNQASSLKDKEKLEQRFQKDYKSLFDKRTKINEEIQKLEGSISVEDVRIKEIQDRLNNLAINKAKLVAELEGINKEYEEYRGAKLRRGLAIEVLKDEIRRFEQSMRNMGNVNMRALEVYEGIAAEFQDLQDKKMKLISEKEDVMKMMAEIETKKKGIFMKTYKIIAENFHRIFMSLSTKGEAFMELENKEDPLQGGLEIIVRIAGNKYLDIKSLSGGEKTLTALAFIFAIQEHQPASFYLLDEVDAALDKKNSALLSQLIKKYSATAQYILISHNDSIISEADQIYGVSMQENGISKIISLKL